VAAAYAVRRGLAPRECASGDAIGAIQQKLLANDCYLPGLSRRFGPATRGARLTASAGDPEPLRDGTGRPVHEADHSWRGRPGDWIEYRWESPRPITSLTVAFDSNLNTEICLTHHVKREHKVPETLARAFSVQAEIDGQWREVCRDDANHQRFRVLPFGGMRATAVRLVPESTHGAEQARVFTLAVNEPSGDEFE
jgi:hypothetical protein